MMRKIQAIETKFVNAFKRKKKKETKLCYCFFAVSLAVYFKPNAIGSFILFRFIWIKCFFHCIVEKVLVEVNWVPVFKLRFCLKENNNSPKQQ